MKKITFSAIFLLLTLFANAEIYFDLTTVGGTKVMDYDAVNTERNKAIGDRWITVVNFGASGTSGKCGSATKTFDIKSGRTIDFFLAKCDTMIITANIASGRSLVVNIDGGSNITLAGTGACVDYKVPVLKEVNTVVRVQGGSSSSSWTSFFTFKYTPKNPVINTFTAEGITATINKTADPKTIIANLPFGTDLSNITPVVTLAGTATLYSPSGGQDFSNSVTTPVVYSATDGVTTTTYNVTLTANKNTDNTLTNLKIGGLTPAFDSSTSTYSLLLAKGSLLSQNVTFDLPFRATADFTSGNAHDFTNHLLINVTAENGDVKQYTLNVTVASKNIAYIINTAISANDTKIRPELAKTYYIDNILIANITTSTDFSTYDLVILTESPSTGSAGMKALWGINKPLLALKMFAMQSNTWNLVSAAVNPNPATNAVIIFEPNHPIFAGITPTGTYVNTINVTSTISSGNGMQVAPYLSNYGLAGIAGTTSPSIIELPVGTASLMTSGYTNLNLSQKLLVFGLSDNNQQNITTDGLTMIKNACNYLTGSTTWGTDAGTLFSATQTSGTSALNVTSNTATITWNAIPASVKYIITSASGPFMIKSQRVKSATNLEIDGATNSYDLTGLNPNTDYVFDIVGQNAAGISSLSTPQHVLTLATGISSSKIEGITFDGKIIYNPQGISLSIYDASGRFISKSNENINMSNKAKGIYFIKSDLGNQKIAVK